MNSLIEEFAEQAKESIPKGMFAPDMWIKEYNRRLGELIVRECAKIANNPAQGCYSSFGDYVLKHFGIDNE